MIRFRVIATTNNNQVVFDKDQPNPAPIRQAGKTEQSSKARLSLEAESRPASRVAPCLVQQVAWPVPQPSKRQTLQKNGKRWKATTHLLSTCR